MKSYNLITVYPDFFESFQKHGLVKKGIHKKLIDINVVNLRDFTDDKHKRIDFRPYGGGPGMIIQYAPVKKALGSLKSSERVILLSPQGKPLTQKKLTSLSKENNITFICGRYEGIDERVISKLIDEEISIGDYVLSGGETAAFVILDAVLRLIPGVLGNKDSIKDETFENSLLEYPQFTKPKIWEGKSVPDVLFSGDHAKIKSWRLSQSEDITRRQRPDLWEKYLKDKK